MTDVADIVRNRSQRSYSKVARILPNHISLESNAASDMFRRPSILGMADVKLKMFSFSMKKRKFPFMSSDKTDGAADEQDIEQTRRLSSISVRHLLLADLDAVCLVTDTSSLCRLRHSGVKAFSLATTRSLARRLTKTRHSSSTKRRRWTRKSAVVLDIKSFFDANLDCAFDDVAASTWMMR
jgi:hypothetical protein